MKLSHVADWNQNRRRVASAYNQLLGDVTGLICPPLTTDHVFHQYTLRITNGRRDELAEAMKAQGISTMVYYPVPQDCLPVYQGQYPPNPVSNQLATEVLSLPIWPEMPEDLIEKVATALRDLLLKQ